jgi:hypothetical protein
MANSRELLDFYETAPWMVRYLIKNHDIQGRIAEPCAGDLSISTVLKTAGYNVVTGDVDQTRPADHYGDATTGGLWDKFGDVDWTVMNPPFNTSYLIWCKAMKRSRVGVAMLNNITWDEPTNERGYALQLNPPQRKFVMPRYSFKRTEKSSTAMTTVAWYIWDVRLKYTPPPILVAFDAKQY